jgi:HemY protein
MRRAIWIFVVLALFVGAAWQLRQMGGSVDIRVGELEIGVSLPILLVALLALFLVLHGLLVLIRWLGGWPARMRLRRMLRRRSEGDEAVTRALVALAAGRGEAARLEVRRARNRLGDTPQTLLLAAEADRAAGRDHDAVEIYRSLSEREDARFLGLRGLLRDAMQRENWPEALRLAREAEAIEPNATWLRAERATLALRSHDWQEALALGAPDAPQAAIALAAAAESTDPEKAAALEKQAFTADPGFAPAALAHADRLTATGNARRAKGVLERAWEAAPHPDLGTAYLGDETDPLARMKAAEHLTHRNRAHGESRLLLARTALQAGLTGRARSELEALIASGQADRRAYLLMVELEKLEQGEGPAGQAAEAKWLRGAATAPAAPGWKCANCGTEHRVWKPVCDHCGTVGRIGWA